MEICLSSISSIFSFFYLSMVTRRHRLVSSSTFSFSLPTGCQDSVTRWYYNRMIVVCNDHLNLVFVFPLSIVEIQFSFCYRLTSYFILLLLPHFLYFVFVCVFLTFLRTAYSYFTPARAKKIVWIRNLLEYVFFALPSWWGWMLCNCCETPQQNATKNKLNPAGGTKDKPMGCGKAIFNLKKIIAFVVSSISNRNSIKQRFRFVTPHLLRSLTP